MTGKSPRFAAPVFTLLTALTVLTGLTVAWLAAAQPAPPSERPPSPNNPSRLSDAQAPDGQIHDRVTAHFPDETRTIDGTGNNGPHPAWGAAGATFLRRLSVAYADGSASPATVDRPSAREVSNRVSDQRGSVPSRQGLSGLVWQWGQFLDHDIDLTPAADPVEELDVPVPAGDRWFDPAGTGEATIPLDRSAWRMRRGVRQQVNEVTAFIDASNVYGSDEERARALRTLDGTGRLKTSPGNLLPFNQEGLPNAPSADASFFLAGDFRANEQIGLTALHTLFMREHNYWARVFRREDPTAGGDELYEKARAMVAAEMQRITYEELLPLLLGRRALGPYQGYQPQVNPGIANGFATAAYRFGHTMLPSELLRLDAGGASIEAGPVSLAQAFFSPSLVIETGIEPILRGLAAQPSQEIDHLLVGEVRNFLFGPPGAGGFDLAALNLQRGRDHGLPSYNQARVDLGLAPAARFADLNPDRRVHDRLRAAYATVDQIDLWIGGLAEPPVEGAAVGPTFHAILVDQFRRLRDGDRFWYQSYLPADLLERVQRQTLARIIRRNTTIGDELPADPFRVAPPPGPGPGA